MHVIIYLKSDEYIRLGSAGYPVKDEYIRPAVNVLKQILVKKMD